MKKIIFLLLFTPTLAWSQYNLTLYQLHETVPQANFLNPGFLPYGQVNIGFPGISNIRFGASNAFSAEDLFTKENKKLYPDLDNFPSKLRKQNYLDINAGIDPLYLGFWVKRNYFSFHTSVRQSSTFGYPGQLIEYIVEGNGGENLGKTVSLDDMILTNTGWLEVGAGYGKAMLNDKLTWGIRAKYLLGGYHMAINRDASGSITTDADNYAVNIALNNLTFNTAGLTAADFHLFDDPDNRNEFNDIEDYLRNSRNRGVAFDFGTTFKVSDELKLYASLVDVGSITWQSAVENYSFENASYTYEGIDMRDAENFGQVLLDSISSTFDPVVSHDSYKQSLSSRFYAGGEYILGKHHALGAVAYGRLVKGKIIPAYSLNYNLKLGRILNTAITYNVMNNSYKNIGAGFSLNLGFWQIYAVTDNIGAYINPHKSKSADLRFGVNMTFGRKRHERIMDGLPGNKKKARAVLKEREKENSEGNL